ncbi:uncharacterized protein K04H4.2-like [Uranotaenia lowii]|uniref:uncharacterized protein K04H4.2-like n=1 Tax=Uranotaenia lowii TaxID=190385 RepID=UPI00247A7614|nr:uncharacterized protein K04H4.2-like [Uranotaenia lowii]
MEQVADRGNWRSTIISRAALSLTSCSSLLLLVLIGGNFVVVESASIKCLNGAGICVAAALCDSTGKVKLYGEGLIDTRRAGNDAVCPSDLVCCEMVSKGNESDVCDGTCVEPGNCEGSLDGTGFIDIRFSEEWCSGGRICCRNSSAQCEAKCVPQDQCLDEIGGTNVRFLKGSCPTEQICCEKVQNVNETNGQKCNGTCVPIGECPSRDSSSGFDLRFGDNLCAANKVCCYDSKSMTTEMPLVDSECQGKCVLPQFCKNFRNLSDSYSVDLRLQGSCPPGQVCCESTSEQSCNGVCSLVEQCEDDLNEIDLRLSQNGCPSPQICCSKLKPSSSCEGQCVPAKQCLDPANGIDLRASNSRCPDNQVCCKNVAFPPESTCREKCVLPSECDDNGIDLRFSTASCPRMKVCCKNVKQGSCDGVCTHLDQCLRQTSGKSLIDLRFGEGDCPGSMVCCKNLLATSKCRGTCIQPYNCLDNFLGFDLRASNDECNINQVCCMKVRKPPIYDMVNISANCDGKCVPLARCPQYFSEIGLIDLRTLNSNCPFNEVCCKTPQTEPYCKGTCTAYENCADSYSYDINLRFLNPICPLNQICCRKTKTVNTCRGKCVEAYHCPYFISNNDLINLRNNDASCPGNQICCTPPGEPSFDTCEGACVPLGQCPQGQLDLRVSKQSCPDNNVCCATNPEPSKCSGQCVPSNQCRDTGTFDLRFITGNCPSNLVCCASPSSPGTDPPTVAPDMGKTDPTPTAEDDSKCYWTGDPNSDVVVKSDIPWLVTVWTRQELFGVSRNQYECVGTLLERDVILTSADCVANLNTVLTFVRIGDYNLRPFNTLSKRREYTVEKITTHPDYDSATGYGNVALLRLNKNSSISLTICLTQRPPQAAELPADCFLIGWSKQVIEDDDNPQSVPEKHRLSVQQTSGCPRDMICAAKTGSSDRCDNFQGSPIICSENGGQIWKQFGVASKSSRKCDENLVPNEVTPIGLYEMWIREQIRPSFEQVTKSPEPSRWYLPAEM